MYISPLSGRRSWIKPIPSAEIAEVLAAMDPLFLGDLDAVRLLDRVDTKFVITDHLLLQILSRVGDDYSVLEAAPTRINRYRTLYFDTPELLTYYHHHNDFHPRYKVRCRQYVDSNTYFMEIKCKTNRRRTVKQRMQTPEMVNRLDAPVFRGQVVDFVSAYAPIPPADLAPCLLNEFDRITLISKRKPERLTIDIDYHHSWHNRSMALPGIVIVEVKQPKFSFDSEFIQQLRAFGIRRTGMSKYCTGIIDLYPYVKYNRFKRRFLMLERLSQRGVP